MKPINALHSVGTFVRPLALALPLALAALSASAQSTMDNSGSSARTSSGYDSSSDATWAPESRSSWLPWTNHGYIGINLGQGRSDNDRCAGGFACDDPDFSGSIYTGGMFNKNFGLELGYVDFGKFDRNGGDTSAHGVNLSLVGNIPLGKSFDIFAKVGTTYGWTKTNALVGPTGDKHSWKPSVGVGVGFDVTERTQFLVEWDRHRFDTSAGDTDPDLYTVGLKYRF